MNILKLRKDRIKIFLDSKLTVSTEIFSPIHKHNYCEIHLVERGKICINVGTQEYVVEENQAILIPADTFHSVWSESQQLKHFAFFTDCECRGSVRKSFMPGLFSALFDQIENRTVSESVCNHLIFIQNELWPESLFLSQPVQDYNLLIGEYLSTNYNRNIHLTDLAELLHLSEMQTQRIVKRCTGKTFGENLLMYRMLSAKELMETGGMTLREIGEYVGYESYSGFWKAYKKYFRESKEAAPL